jgi:hypothetical protein
MTDKAISPLRQRMIEDMTVRRFTAKTQSDHRDGPTSTIAQTASMRSTARRAPIATA